MFTTREVMCSPYNYFWYRPRTASKLWVFARRIFDLGNPSVWRGKSYDYTFSLYSRWLESYWISFEMECLWKEYVMQMSTFVMGSHARLGAESPIRWLDPLMIQRIMSYPEYY
jgi:hypothetical protein